MSVENPRVSVVLSVYNGEEALERCLTSITSQTYQDWEFVIVDDGSTDSTLEIARRFADSEPRVRVIHQENGGRSAGRNTGIENARGEYLIIMDCDDYIEPNTLEICVNAMDEKNLDLVIGSFSWEFFQGARTNILSKTVCGPKDDYYFNCAHMDEAVPYILSLGERAGCLHYCMWGRMYRKSIIDRHHMRFDVSMSWFEDCKFIYEYYLYAGNCMLSKEVFYHYGWAIDKNLAVIQPVDIFRMDEKSMEPLIKAKTIYHFSDEYHKLMIDRIMRLYVYVSRQAFSPEFGLSESEQADIVKQISEEFSFHYFIDLFAEDVPAWANFRDLLAAGDYDGLFKAWKDYAFTDIWRDGE